MPITETGFFTATSGSRLAAAEGVGKRRKRDTVCLFFKRVTKTRSAARRACRTEAARLCFRKGNEKSHPATIKGRKKDIPQKSLDFQGFFVFLPLDHIITRKKILTLTGFELPEFEYCSFVHRKKLCTFLLKFVDIFFYI